jgi:nicotinamidase-related amidase
LSLLVPEECLLVEIDIQEKFIPIVWRIDEVIDNANRLLAGAALVDMPVIASEQYPEGLGRTSDRVNLPGGLEPHWKVHFNCFKDERFTRAVASTGKRQLVVCGIEAHVCVCQSVLSALALGYEVHVAADAVSSRSEQNRSIGIERMRQSGAFIASTEMLLFQFMDHSKDPRFPELSRIVKG